MCGVPSNTATKKYRYIGAIAPNRRNLTVIYSLHRRVDYDITAKHSAVPGYGVDSRTARKSDGERRSTRSAGATANYLIIGPTRRAYSDLFELINIRLYVCIRVRVEYAPAM